MRYLFAARCALGFTEPLAKSGPLDEWEKEREVLKDRVADFDPFDGDAPPAKKAQKRAPLSAGRATLHRRFRTFILKVGG